MAQSRASKLEGEEEGGEEGGAEEMVYDDRRQGGAGRGGEDNKPG